MDAAEIVKNLRDSIVELKSRGSHFVTVPQLERWTDGLEKDVSESIEHLRMEHDRETELMRLDHLNKLEEYKVQRNADLEGYKAQVSAYMESFKSTVDAGREALKAVVLINGGAAVVLVGFLGSVTSRAGAGPLGAAMTEPLVAFGYGVVCGALGFGARYLSQALFTGISISTTRRWAGRAFQAISIALALGAYAYFAIGLLTTQAAFLTHFATLK